MRESIGGTALFQIAIVFLLLFTGVMCITINHSKAFGVKDEIVQMIQNNAVAYGSSDKLSNELIGEITSYINESGYRSTNSCPNGDDDGNYIGYTREGKETTGSDASICIRAVDVASSYDGHMRKKCSDDCDYVTGDMPAMYYYDIILFYQIDAPILDNIFNFTVKSSTKLLYS